MNMESFRIAAGAIVDRKVIRKVRHTLAAAAVAILIGAPAYAEVAQSPLYLGGGNVPGNLLLVPSVEWPTIVSVANLGAYDPTRTFAGYFDANKCYAYDNGAADPDEHFYPVGAATGHVCSGLWSGNFMNWAATQTIDPFRSVLTGGYRVRDTASETWLEKARHTGQGGTNIYPDRRLDTAALVQGATPFNANELVVRIQDLENEMRITTEIIGDGNGDLDIFDFFVRVKVCVAGMLEANCRAYPSGYYKPEGLIQQYADELRIGIFGFLNDPSMLRDGGALRARQGFVGPTMIVPGDGETTNPNTEWNPDTGVFVRNPDATDAAATASALGIAINDSGAINYLNKFGQMTTHDHKNYDPVSELFYSAVRYLKDQGNVPAYSNIPGNTSVDATRATDRFPVITDWDDPIQYACQKNVILGIGDVYTHRDKNLPGSGYSSEEPTKPSAVSADDTVDVVTATGEVAQLEGITLGTPFNNGGTRNNSAFIAGLAWDSHVRDIRLDLPGDQTVSTHWVDVLEAQTLERPAENQYYLAAKYGGFDVPEDFDPDTFTGSLDLEWWHTNGEMLDSFGNGTAGAPFARPDNYYVAGSANQMVDSLTKAFARISNELRSSASSVAANSTRLGSDTAVFQASFDSTNWSGELQAFPIDLDGIIDTTLAWSAASQMDALTESDITERNVLTVTPPAAVGDGSLVSTTGADFVWAELAATQQDALRTDPDSGTLLSTTVGQDRLAFLRGSRVKEQPDGAFRQRDSRLGDIVNSDPQFVHKQDYGYALLDQSAAFSGDGLGAAYLAFRALTSYQNRTPMVVVAANDGMLHGFDASLGTSGSGTELFAFLPNAAFENLYELTLPEYSHRFFVDGSPRVADVYYGSDWHTIAVGVTGAGGKSVFAVDVTNPAAIDKTDVLWEFNHPSLGYTIGQPAVAPLPNGEFGVVVTSGYDTGVDDGVIWILDPADGSIIRSFTVTGSGDLGPPLVVDLNSDRVSDRIYVGDTDGNLWRFDLEGSTVSNWKPPAGLLSSGVPLPLFVAVDANGVRQPITAPLSSAFNDKGKHTVFFGTGAFYKVDDNVVPDDPNVDTFYGIIDGGAPVSRGDLLEQTILTEVTVGGMPVRGISANEMDPSDKGWFLDLVWHSSLGGPGPVGERVVSKATMRGDRVIFATLVPNPDPCAFGGKSWIMELNTFTGGRLDYAVFDLDGDVQFDEDDWITINVDGTDVKIPPSAVMPGISIVKTPAIISGVGENQDELLVMSGSNGELMKLLQRGSVDIGRQSWRQLR